MGFVAVGQNATKNHLSFLIYSLCNPSKTQSYKVFIKRFESCPVFLSTKSDFSSCPVKFSADMTAPGSYEVTKLHLYLPEPAHGQLHETRTHGAGGLLTWSGHRAQLVFQHSGGHRDHPPGSGQSFTSQ